MSTGIGFTGIYTAVSGRLPNIYFTVQQYINHSDIISVGRNVPDLVTSLAMSVGP